jgi:LuxR family transcriptional regulator, maltose regulon positive regulatory protein
MRTGHAATLRRLRPSVETGRTRPGRDVPPGWVARPQLVQALIDARLVPLTLIVAPPGYGKSTLLHEWGEHDDREFAWLTPAQSTRLALAVRRIRRRYARFVVVVDDAHLVESGALRIGVDAALAELPAGSAIALASRRELDLPIGRLRAHRLLSELRVEQLAMDCYEGATLLRQMGVERDVEEVQALVDHTDGWPAALYLAALTLYDHPDGLSSFGGEHHILSEYLKDEVLDPMPDDLRAFAIRTSVLDELSGAICDVVLDRDGSALVLDELARTSPLLVAVDPAHRRYRWHAIVREALVDRLERIDPGLEHTLRLRASGWCSDHGDPDGAIDHAAVARDAALTGGLLWRNILAYVTCGRGARVRRWLGNFDGDTIASHPSLALSAAFSALAAGDLHDAERLSRVAAAGLERSGRNAHPPSLQTGLAVIESIGAHDGPWRMADIALSAAESEPEDSPWRGVCLLLRAVATYLRGDRASAERQLDECIRLNSAGVPAFAALCLAQRAIVAVESEDWDLAAELTDRAAMLVEEWGLTSDPLSALTFAAAAASRAHHGRIDEAKRDLRRGSDLLASVGDFVPWYGAQARILLAHASLSLADAVGARTLLAEASRFARKTPGAVVFSSWFDRAWAHMDTLAETSLAGPSSLTIAELRILRFLPSHRSFREIALQLGVSSNTVKTQAHAVYRKLGAASRSEAVAQAMEAGLLGG